MRYAGGLLGGSWLTALTGDMGHDLLRQRLAGAEHENLNPANTLWTKQYNLYSKIDTDPRAISASSASIEAGTCSSTPRRCSTSSTTCSSATSWPRQGLVTMDGRRIDLRDPLADRLLLLKGDNITPPPQALGWITDLYQSVDDIARTARPSSTASTRAWATSASSSRGR